MEDDRLNDYKGGKQKDQARGKQEIQVSNAACFHLFCDFVYFDLGFNTFVEHDAIQCISGHSFCMSHILCKGGFVPVPSRCAWNIPKSGSSAVTFEIIPRMQQSFIIYLDTLVIHRKDPSSKPRGIIKRLRYNSCINTTKQ